MNRQNGSRPLAQKSVTRLLAAIATFALGAVAILLLQPAAHADSASVTLGKSSYSGAVTIEAGGSVTFSAIPTQGANLLLYSGMYLSGPGVDAYFIKAGGQMPPVTFPSAGDAKYTWKPKCTCGVHSWTVTISVTDPPPPPPTSSTPVDPTSTDPGNPSTTAGGTPTGTPTGTTTGTGTGTGTAVPSGSGTGAGGISFGSGGVIDNNNPLPIGFNGPPADPNHPTPVIPNPIGSGEGVVPTGGATSGATSSGSSQTLDEVANSKAVSKGRPTSLAIISIAVLAIVSSVYAYRRLGESVQRPLH